MQESIGTFDQKKFDMSEIKDLVTVNDYCAGFDLSALHPFVSIMDLSEGTWAPKKKVEAVRYHFYAVFLKQGQSCILRYGRQNYDYQDGTLVFFARRENVRNFSIIYKLCFHLFHNMGSFFQPSAI